MNNKHMKQLNTSGFLTEFKVISFSKMKFITKPININLNNFIQGNSFIQEHNSIKIHYTDPRHSQK